MAATGDSGAHKDLLQEYGQVEALWRIPGRWRTRRCANPVDCCAERPREGRRRRLAPPPETSGCARAGRRGTFADGPALGRKRCAQALVNDPEDAMDVI